MMIFFCHNPLRTLHCLLSSGCGSPVVVIYVDDARIAQPPLQDLEDIIAEEGWMDEGFGDSW